MDRIKSLIAEKYQNLCSVMERETLGTEIIIYGTSSLMLLIAYVKNKPAYLLRPFKKPSHIPDRLIKDRAMHTGIVCDVQQKGADTLLLISHRPLIPFFMSNKRLLPIKLPGIKVNGNGVSWMQSCLVGREATFIPLNNRASDKYVVSQLCLVHPSKGNRLLDVSETLLKLRFAHFAEEIDGGIKKYEKYYKHLADVETTTQSRESLILKVCQYPLIWKKIHDLKAYVLPKEKLLPELVR